MPAALSFVTNASVPPAYVLWMRAARGTGKAGPTVVCPRHVGVARRSTAIPLPASSHAAAQIGRIDEGRAGGVELRDEGIGTAAGRALDGTAAVPGKPDPVVVVIPVT